MIKETTLNKKYILVLIGICITQMAIAQNFAEDLAMMQRTYQGIEDISATMYVHTKDAKGMPIPEMDKKVEIQKKGPLMYYEIGDTKMLYAKEQVVWVSGRAKTIMVQKRPPSSGENLMDDMGIDWDSLMNDQGNARYMGEQSGLRHYVITGKEAPKLQVNIWIDMEKGFYRKMVYDYKEPFTQELFKISIEFKKWDTDPVFSAGDFAITDFVRQEGERFVPDKKYAGYQVSSPKM